MKQEFEIKEKFYSTLDKEFKKRLQLYLDRKYINCIYNVRYDVKDYGKVGFCSHSEVLKKSIRNTFVCSDMNTCKDCLHYECKHTRESIKDDFEKILGDPVECGRVYPKIAVLIWLFNDEKNVKPHVKLKNSIATCSMSFLNIIFFRWLF